jgi:hypothetical protein
MRSDGLAAAQDGGWRRGTAAGGSPSGLEGHEPRRQLMVFILCDTLFYLTVSIFYV